MRLPDHADIDVITDASSEQRVIILEALHELALACARQASLPFPGHRLAPPEKALRFDLSHSERGVRLRIGCAPGVYERALAPLRSLDEVLAASTGQKLGAFQRLLARALGALFPAADQRALDQLKTRAADALARVALDSTRRRLETALSSAHGLGLFSPPPSISTPSSSPGL